MSIEMSIVGAETAVSVIFARESEYSEETKAGREQEYSELYENPYRAAERGYVDDIILPRDTRKMINRALDVLDQKWEHAFFSRPWRKYSDINL